MQLCKLDLLFPLLPLLIIVMYFRNLEIIFINLLGLCASLIIVGINLFRIQQQITLEV